MRMGILCQLQLHLFLRNTQLGDVGDGGPLEIGGEAGTRGRAEGKEEGEGWTKGQERFVG